MNNLKERDEFEHYRKIKLLGEGSFGKAYLIQRISDNLNCVMKVIDIGRMSESEKKETLQEAKIIEHLEHPNIVKFIETFKTKRGKLCIVMDYADGGDIGQKIKEQRGRAMSENQVLDWFTQMCLGMKHIHDRKIIHRDIKGANVFLTKKGIVKIGDFGIAKVLSHTIQKARTMVGTPYYLSPEIVQSKPYNSKTDIWSMGVMLYELCALRPPFDAPSIHLLTMKIVRGVYSPIPSQYSSELKTLIKQMLEIRTELRPDVNQILQMPLIKRRIKQYLSETLYQVEFSHTILHKEHVFAQKNRLAERKPQSALPSSRPDPIAVARQQPVQPPAQAPAQPKPPANDAQAQKRRENAMRYLQGGNQVAKPAEPARPNRYGISPGMAAAMGKPAGAGYNGGYRAGTPSHLAQDQKKPEFIGGPKKYGYQGGGAAVPNYHYQKEAGNKVGGTPRAGGGDLAIGGQNYQDYQRKRMEEIQANKLKEADRLIAEKAKRDKEVAIAKVVAEKKKMEEEKRQWIEKNRMMEQKMKAKEEEFKRQERLRKEAEEHLKRERELVELQKKNKVAEEKARLEIERRQEQERIVARLKIQQRQEEANRERRAREEEQRQRRKQQEEISRKIQEDHMKKREEREKVKYMEKEARAKEIQAQAEKRKAEEERRLEQRKAADAAKREQAQRDIEEARKQRILREKEREEKRLRDYEEEQERLRKARAEEKAERERQANLPPQMKPESTIMRLCNDAQRFVNDIDQKIQQKGAPQLPPYPVNPASAPREPEVNLETPPRVKKEEKPPMSEREKRKLKMEEDRKKMKQDIANRAQIKKPDFFLEINNCMQQPSKVLATPKQAQPAHFFEKRDDSKNRISNMPAAASKPSTAAKPSAPKPSSAMKARPMTSNHKPKRRPPKPEWNNEIFDPRLPEVKPNPQPTDHLCLQKQEISEKNLPEIDPTRHHSQSRELKEQKPPKMKKAPSQDRPRWPSKSPDQVRDRPSKEEPFDQPPVVAMDDDTSNFEVYKMLEEYMNLVQTEFNPEEASTDISTKAPDSAPTRKSPKPSPKPHRSPKPSPKPHRSPKPSAQSKPPASKRKQWGSPVNDASPKKEAAVEETKEMPHGIDSSSSDDDFGRNPFASPLKQSPAPPQPNKFNPRMTEVVEETEPESSFKETKEQFYKPPASQQPIPKAIPEVRKSHEEEDRDDDFSMESEEEKEQEPKSSNALKDFTFIPPKKDDPFGVGDIDESRLNSIEQIREYLEGEIGIDLLMKVYPIITEFGDDILFADKVQDLKDQLSHLLTEQQVDRYLIYFSTLVFYELEVEKANRTQKEEGGKQDEPHDPSAFMGAVNCFNNVAATAKFGLHTTIGKHY